MGFLDHRRAESADPLIVWLAGSAGLFFSLAASIAVWVAAGLGVGAGSFAAKVVLVSPAVEEAFRLLGLKALLGRSGSSNRLSVPLFFGVGWFGFEAFSRELLQGVVDHGQGAVYVAFQHAVVGGVQVALTFVTYGLLLRRLPLAACFAISLALHVAYNGYVLFAVAAVRTEAMHFVDVERSLRLAIVWIAALAAVQWVRRQPVRA